jgi:hypothetical protein
VIYSILNGNGYLAISKIHTDIYKIIPFVLTEKDINLEIYTIFEINESELKTSF